MDYDICLLSLIVQTDLDLEREASGVELEINTNKAKVLRLIGHHFLPICFNGQSFENVDQFVHLGSVVSADGGTELNIARRINSTLVRDVIEKQKWQ